MNGHGDNGARRQNGAVLGFFLGWTQRSILLSLVLLLAACAHYINIGLCSDSDACNYNPATGYRLHPEWKPDRDTLFVATFSGGGTRAASLAYGAMEALSEIQGVGGKPKLIDNLDIVSSVSGGSVTAAWYALHGPEGFVPPGNQRLWNFLHADGTTVIALRGLNPVAWARYLFTPYQRSDVLSGYFASSLFDDARYTDISARYQPGRNQGYVILNATDVGHEVTFPFIQNTFDLICSNLDNMRVADAVTASANFPFVFSASGIKNYSTCAAQGSPAFLNKGPPVWISKYKSFNTGLDQRPNAGAELPRPSQLSSIQQARQAYGYLHPRLNDRYLHLLDGGLADNLGIRSTLNLTDAPDQAPGIGSRVGRSHRPVGYVDVSKVLYLVVNARTVDAPSADSALYPPSELSTAFGVVYTALGNATLDVEALLNSELQAATTKTPLLRTVKSPITMQTQPYIVSVDAEVIPDRVCREWFWKIPTTWKLPNSTIGALVALGRTLVLNSPGMKDYLAAEHIAPPSAPDFSEACAEAWKKDTTQDNPNNAQTDDSAGLPKILGKVSGLVRPCCRVI